MNPKTPDPRPRLVDYVPGLTCAVLFALADVLGKLALASGTDVLTLVTARTVVGLALMAGWIAFAPALVPLTRRERWFSYLVGLLYAGIMYGIFEAIARLTVPMAVLTYFTYPLATGLVGALLGVETLGWRALVATLAAFVGLAVMIGATPSTLSAAGLAWALFACACRVAVLLISRTRLAGADPRLATWHSNVVTMAVFCGLSLATRHWTPPSVPIGWLWLVLIGITTTLGVAATFVSTTRVGPFRTALAMKLEPLLATILSALFLGELFTPTQMAGAALMIAALFAFQTRR